MIDRLVGRPARSRALSRIERPEALLLAVVMAVVAAAGWVASPFWLSVAVAGELAVGGLGAVWLIGPARAGLGFARYATLAVAGVAVTLFGRVLIDSAGLVPAPVVALLLWSVIWVELRADRDEKSGLGLDLALVGIIFTGTAGLNALIPVTAWPPGLVLVLLVALVPALRAAEARGRSGAEAVGQATLHLLAVAQVGAAVTLLHLPGLVGPAVVALGFHAWGGAAEALDGGSSARSVVIEFGALALVGVVVALLLRAA